MTSVIEKNFIDLQQRTTHVLVEQKVIVSEQEMVDNFLDKINETKKDHANLILAYQQAIELTVDFLSESRSVSDLIFIAESINNLVDTTKRLIHSFEDAKFKGIYFLEAKEYKILLNDIHEIFVDVEGRIKKDSKLSDLLDEIHLS